MSGQPALASNCGCPAWGRPAPIVVEMSDGRGGPSLTMTSCIRCEQRSWSSADGSLGQPDLL